MGYLGVYRAVFDHVPQNLADGDGDAELAISKDDLLYILEQDEDANWWKARKKASNESDDEPEGLVPKNYIEEAEPVAKARALYEYTRQTEEELSFPDGASLNVYDTSDADWTLVGFEKDFGFVPSNYIEVAGAAAESDQGDDDDATPGPPALPTRPTLRSEPDTAPPAHHDEPAAASRSTPAAASLASVLQGRTAASTSPPPRQSLSPDRSEPSEDDDVPALPTRPEQRIETASRGSSDRYRAEAPGGGSSSQRSPIDSRLAPGGFHLYNLNEMVSVLGKKKKMPSTLGVNLATRTILIAPERSQDGPSQEWTADRMTHYSREGKHVFVELVRPSRSIDFHAGAKDTAEEIVLALGELAGAVRADGLRDVITGSRPGQKKGVVLYDFMAQGDDEVTVAVGDEVVVIDDSTSEEWWTVRRSKNGKEGVVPCSYIEVTGIVTPPAQGGSALSTVEQNRLEDVRLTREAIRASRAADTAAQVGPGMPLPARASSLSTREEGNTSGQGRNRRENGRPEGGNQTKTSKSRPDPGKVRTWTDRSRSFKVEAQFLALRDGKINLHKMNGVKIAVPVAKMSVEDLEYVERTTGASLLDEKPSDSRRTRPSASPAADAAGAGAGAGSKTKAGASVEQARKPEYDWFQFFLSCDVAIGLCERYAQAFIKDSMDESVLPDVDAAVLRTLGLREGDILKVMRTLDARFGRGRANRSMADSSGDGGGGGGLFSGPGGALRNNTKKGRPAPAVQTSSTVDPTAFSSSHEDGGGSTVGGQGSSAPAAKDEFDSDPWDVKPSKAGGRAGAAAQQSQPERVESPEQPTARSPPPAAQPSLTGSMKELSLLTPPLEPSRASEVSAAPAPVPAQTSPPQPSGASPSFFTAMAQSPSAASRQRPAPPPAGPSQGALAPPPPPRPLSAPQSAQPSAFAPPPLVPQMTGAAANFQTQVAPPGQSLGEMNQMRLQQQMAQQQQQQQAYASAQVAQMTGYVGLPQHGFMGSAGPPGQPVPYAHAAMATGMPQAQGPFADPRGLQMSPAQPQQTGFAAPFAAPQPMQPMPVGSVNSYLPPALEPQRTGYFPHGSSAAPPPAFGSGQGSGLPPPVAQPLRPQKTGPPPEVRFGVAGEGSKLVPQPTGRRANLAHATPENPFGF